MLDCEETPACQVCIFQINSTVIRFICKDGMSQDTELIL